MTRLDGQAATVQQEDKQDDVEAKRVDTAADLAVKVVASMVSVPKLSENEVVQVVREYLAGLIEDSPLADTFAAWIEHIPGAKPPPSAEAEVVPDPGQLERAAESELSADFSSNPDEDPVTDPIFNPDSALTTAEAEDPIDAAVDIINQARYGQTDSGSCAGCSVPGDNGDDGGNPVDEPPEDHFEVP